MDYTAHCDVTGSAVLLGIKPSPEPNLTSCQLDSNDKLKKMDLEIFSACWKSPHGIARHQIDVDLSIWFMSHEMKNLYKLFSSWDYHPENLTTIVLINFLKKLRGCQ